MQILRETIRDLLDYRGKLGNKATIHYKRDLATMTSLKIAKHYMILPPTARNLAIVENLRFLFPNLPIVQECNPETRQSIDLLEVLRKPLNDNSITVEDVINTITENSIVIDRNEDIDEYLDAAKINNILAGGKRYVIKQIGFFGHQNPRFNSYNKCLGDRINQKLKENGSKLEIQYINVGADHSISIIAKAALPMKTELTQEKLDKAVTAIKLKKDLQNELREWLSEEFKLTNGGIIFSKNMKIQLPKAEVDLFKNVSYVSMKTGLQVEKNRRLNNKRFESWFEIKKIPFEEFYKFVEFTIFEKIEVI